MENGSCTSGKLNRVCSHSAFAGLSRVAWLRSIFGRAAGRFERSDVTEVFFSPAGDLHRDELLVARVEDAVDRYRTGFELFVAACARDVLHDVKSPMPRLQDPVATGAKALLVRPEAELPGRDVAEVDLCLQVSQRGSQPVEVGAGRSGHDVDVLRRPHIAVRGQRKASDDDELDSVSGEHSQQRPGVERSARAARTAGRTAPSAAHARPLRSSLTLRAP